MPDHLPDVRDPELNDLWLRRPALSAEEWRCLYSLTVDILREFRPSELSSSSLREDKLVYVHQYFTDKVLRLVGVGGGMHVNALRMYYRNYLIDLFRKEKRYKAGLAKLILPRDAIRSGPMLAEDEADEITMTGALPGGGCCADFSEDERDTWVHDTGTTIESLQARADDWLTRQKAWVRDYLAFNFCPGEEEREALSKLATRRAISSYHYNAEKLGINWRGKKTAKGVSFENTMLGQWMQAELGLRIVREDSALVDISLKILCDRALLWRAQQENAR
jgi:hypothetical protein